MQLTKNVVLGEMACRCGCGHEKKPEVLREIKRLAPLLQAIRDHFGARIWMTSGARCRAHNKAEGGSTGSFHILGMAADIVIEGATPEEVVAFAATLPAIGAAVPYPGRTHVDTRQRVNGKALTKWE